MTNTPDGYWIPAHDAAARADIAQLRLLLESLQHRVDALENERKTPPMDEVCQEKSCTHDR